MASHPAHGLDKRDLRLPFDRAPAVGRITVSSPLILRALEDFNTDKCYSQQIKPFNFLVSCHVRPLGHPTEVDPARFHLIAPYATNPSDWVKLKWIDQYTGKLYRVSTSGNYSSRQTARVKTFGDVISEYSFHAEPKCADARGAVCGKDSRGLLHRRRVQIERIRFIGKESNVLEEAYAGLIHSSQDAYTEYVDPSRDEWERKIRPALRKVSLSVSCKATGFSRRALINWRTGKSRPHPRNQLLLVAVMRQMGFRF
jgi:hypothetical protein